MRCGGRWRKGQSRCYTQQDPIGLAGGLNLYGFASGDPVNFSDPFGLCPTCPAAAAAAVAVGGIRLVGNLLTGRPALENVGRDALIAGAGVLTLGAALPVIAAAGIASAPEAVTAVDAARRALSNADRAGLREFFGKGLRGAQERAANFRVPEGLTPDALQNYATIARDAIARGADRAGTQAARLQLVERAFEAMKQQ